MAIQPGELRLMPALARLFRSISSGIAKVASFWAQVLDSEEQRFQRTLGKVDDEAADTGVEAEQPSGSCSVEESAPSLADMIRERQQKQAPRDFMYNADDEDGK